MSKMIAFCGLDCSVCPTYLATKADDDEARKKTAAFYTEKFGFDMTPEEINCRGCHSESGVLISYCRTCEIRKCGREKGIGNCRACKAQPCDKLVKFHAFSPDAKAAFQALPEARR